MMKIQYYSLIAPVVKRISQRSSEPILRVRFLPGAPVNMKKIFSIPKEVSAVTETLENKGFEAYLVGGCVRDLLLEKKPRDWDITTNAKPEEIIASFEETFYENEYGTVGVVNKNTEDLTLKVIEVTPYRIEGGYSDKRRPDSVEFSQKIEDDLKRRDFTINALALKLGRKIESKYEGTLVDNFSGQDDLKKGLIRAVGKPHERFNEDALRALRAIRLVAELGFVIEAETEKAIADNAVHLKEIAPERIREEFIRIIESPSPADGLMLAKKLGVLQYIIPEIEEGVEIKQNKAHAFDVFEHIMRTLAHAAKKGFPLEVRLAALLHDIGKPRTRAWSDEKKDWTFYGHDVVGSKITAKILSRMRFPTKTIDAVTRLVRWHMFFSDTEHITLSAVRRIVAKVGTERVWDLMNVRICDRIGTGRPKESPYRLRKYNSMVEEVLRDPISVGMLKIKGARIIEIAKIAPGPKIGQILHAILEEVLEDPKRNNIEYLEKKAVELANLPESELKTLGEKGKEKKEKEEEKELKEIRKKYWVE